MKTLIEALILTALLALPGLVEAQQQESLFIAQEKPNFYGVDTSDPIVGYLNWNVARNAQIADQLRYEQLRPPVKVEQHVIVEQPSQPVAPSQYGVFAPLIQPAPVYNFGNRR